MMRTGFLIVLIALVIPFAPVEAKGKTNIACKVAADDKLVQAHQDVTITWQVSHAIFGYGPDGSRVSPFGSIVVEPTKTTVYKFKFVGAGGSERCGVRVKVKGDQVKK